MERDYVLFTDTDTDITPSVAEEYGYHLISMPYTAEGKDVYPYVDFKDFDAHAFYDKLRKGLMPKTSALPPKAYKDAFEPFLKAGKDVLYAHFSRAMSGTFNSMDVALKELKEQYPERTVYTVDAKGITICAYGVIREVGDLYSAGKTAQEIVAWAETEVDKFPTYFFVNDLTFFKRSGRVKSIAAFMGNMLGIRPILNMDSDGLMKPVGKVRGLNGAITKIGDIVEELQDDIKSHRVIIGHSDAMDTVKKVEAELKKRFGDDLGIEIFPLLERTNSFS